MKAAVDSYCWHRQFGDWYPEIQRDPGVRVSIWEVIARAKALGLAGISLEACYMPPLVGDMVARLRAALEGAGLEPVWAWGHPNGLGSGAKPEAAKDLIAHIAIAKDVGARVMRICCGGRRTRPASWPEHKARLLPLLREIVRPASEAGVVLAIENHLDFLADELVELIEEIGSPWLGVCLDTANNLRLLEDPAAVTVKLAPYTRATHLKDCAAWRGNPRDFAFWPSTPLGQGIIDIPAVIESLTKAGYLGLLAIEIDYLHPKWGEDEEGAIAESVRYLKQVLDQHRARYTLR
jgi:sugar phosphate isomerase/epimerase